MRADRLAQPVTKCLRHFEAAGQPNLSPRQGPRWKIRREDMSARLGIESQADTRSAIPGQRARNANQKTPTKIRASDARAMADGSGTADGSGDGGLTRIDQYRVQTRDTPSFLIRQISNATIKVSLDYRVDDP